MKCDTRNQKETATSGFREKFMNLFFAPLTLVIFMLTAGCVWLSPAADAAGLGHIKVESTLGQPFMATIEITALQADEFSQIEARIANTESYEAAQISYPSIGRQIRISTARQSNGKSTLKLTSSAPVNEPLLELLVEFSWGNGRVMQKYSVLLDLPKVDPK